MHSCLSPIRRSSATTLCAWPVTVSRGVTLEQVAKDFGIHPMTLSTWMRKADIDDGTRPPIPVSGSDLVELAEARRRIRLLEQENEVLRRAAAYLSQANLPGKGCTRS